MGLHSVCPDVASEMSAYDFGLSELPSSRSPPRDTPGWSKPRASARALGAGLNRIETKFRKTFFSLTISGMPTRGGTEYVTLLAGLVKSKAMKCRSLGVRLSQAGGKEKTEAKKRRLVLYHRCLQVYYIVRSHAVRELCQIYVLANELRCTVSDIWA